MVRIQGAAIVFFSVSDRLHGDVELRNDALRVRECLAREDPSQHLHVLMRACVAAVVPVDGSGRTIPCRVAENGQIGTDLWRQFADARTDLVPDGQLWKRSREGRVELETGQARLTMRGGRARRRQVTISARASLHSPDPLAELATMVLPANALPVYVRWREPFVRLFPGAASLEAFVEQQQVRHVLELAANGSRREALAIAETALAQWSFPLTLPSVGVFWQIAMSHERESAVLYDAEFSLGIEAHSWEELAQDPRFIRRVRQATSVPFLLGFVGLIWWQVHQVLRAGYLPSVCEFCSRLLPAEVTARRRFCSQTENPTCAKARHRDRMRRWRRL